MEKPITVAREDFIKDLNDLIRNSGLPLVVLSPIFSDMNDALRSALKRQTEEDRIRYTTELRSRMDCDGQTD